jgi:hypothetical protein
MSEGFVEIHSLTVRESTFEAPTLYLQDKLRKAIKDFYLLHLERKRIAIEKAAEEHLRYALTIL